mmetsp:Transcript_13527/g.44724  ORF Transcript_13527/g.44724 Transcript_13527/m.44724 type:complete len:277 (-) Transcript_13527:1021-1851(-)
MYWVICVVFPDPVSPTTTTIWFSRITCIKSCLLPYTGRNSRCCFMVLVLENSDRFSVGADMWSENLAPCLKLATSISSAVSFFASGSWFGFAVFFKPFAPAPATSSFSSPACFRCFSAFSIAWLFSARVVPVTLPIAVPFISQNRSRDLFSSRFVRTSVSNALPFRAIMAMSLVGSFTGNTLSCFFPPSPTSFSKNGGRVSCTNKITLLSSSVSKSRSTSRTRTTPEFTIRVSSHWSWSAWMVVIFLLCARVIGRPSRLVSRFWYAFSFVSAFPES